LGRTFRSSTKDATRTMLVRTRNVASKTWDVTKTGANQVKDTVSRGKHQTAVWITAAITNPDITRPVEQWASNTFNTLSNAYSKAIDGDFAIHGPSVASPDLHRILDGHDLMEAFRRSMDAKPDDSFFQEVSGYFGAMISDMSSVIGIPLFTLSKESLSGLLQFSHEIGISQKWILDLLHINTVEILGSAFPMAMVLLNLKAEDKIYFERLTGSLAFGAFASANPLGAVLAFVMLALSVAKARRKDEKISLRGIGSGALQGAGVFAATTILGPVPVALGLACLIIALVLRRHGKLESVDRMIKSVGAIMRAAYYNTRPRLRNAQAQSGSL
jgi:hypothetical protein